MRSSIITLFSLLLIVRSFAQPRSPSYSTEIQEYKPTKEYIIESYISPDGSYSVFLTPLRFYIIDNNSGDKRVSKKLIAKSVQSIEENSPGKLPAQGAAFMVTPATGKVVLLDWSIDTREVEVFDTKSGNSLWSSSDYIFTNTGSEMAEKLAVDAAAGILARETSASVTDVENPQQIQTRFVTSKEGPYLSEDALFLITPVDGENQFLLNSADGQRMIDAETGKALWEFDDFPLVVGAYKFIPKRNEIVLVNENQNLTGENTSLNTTVILDVKTGKERLRFLPIDPVRSDYMYVVEGFLIMDFENVTALDLETGEIAAQSYKPYRKDNEKDNLINNISQSNRDRQEIPGLNSIIEYPFVYTGYVESGGYTYATSSKPNLGTKIDIAKMNLETGEIIWEADKVDDAIHQIPVVTEKYVILKRSAWGKKRWIFLDKESGKKVKELDVDKGDTYWTENRVFHAAKKSLDVYDLSEEVSKIAELDYKSLQIGDIEHLVPSSSGAAGIGKEGLIWIHHNGEVQNQILTEKVEAFLYDEAKTVLVHKKMLNVVDMEKMRKESVIDFKFKDDEDIILFDDNTMKVILVDDRKEVIGY